MSNVESDPCESRLSFMPRDLRSQLAGWSAASSCTVSFNVNIELPPCTFHNVVSFHAIKLACRAQIFFSLSLCAALVLDVCRARTATNDVVPAGTSLVSRSSLLQLQRNIRLFCFVFSICVSPL
jgi:hypothetical protein